MEVSESVYVVYSGMVQLKDSQEAFCYRSYYIVSICLHLCLYHNANVYIVHSQLTYESVDIAISTYIPC